MALHARKTAGVQSRRFQNGPVSPTLASSVSASSTVCRLHSGQLVFVPAVGKLPALLGCERRAALDVAGLAPAINVLFGTEDEHRASGEANVVPPMVRGNSEVNDSLAALQLPGCDLQQHRLATVATSRSDDGVRAQRRHNAERIPNTDAPVRFSTSFNPEG